MLRRRGIQLRTAARQAVAIVPGLGWAVKAAIGYTGTQAMGRAAIEYFEGGGNIAGLATVVGYARDKAVQVASTAKESPLGQTLGKSVGHAVREAAARMKN